jgi:hypothetical protein
VVSVVNRVCSNNEHDARRCVLRVCYHRDEIKVRERREKKRIRGEGFTGRLCLEYLSCESFSELDPAVLALEEPD